MVGNIKRMSRSLDKIYCYVDESGQHTKGEFYSVAVVIANTIDIRNKVEQRLIEIEENTKKGLSKWKSTHYTIKERYLRSVITIPELERCIFYSIYTQTRDYVNATVETISGVIHQHVEKTCQAIVVIDGLDKKSKQQIFRRLKEKGVVYKRVSGIRDEGSAWIRLADAIAGFSWHVYKNKPYTQTLFPEMQQKGYLIQLYKKNARVSGSSNPT